MELKTAKELFDSATAKQQKDFNIQVEKLEMLHRWRVELQYIQSAAIAGRFAHEITFGHPREDTQYLPAIYIPVVRKLLESKGFTVLPHSTDPSKRIVLWDNPK